MQLDQATEIDSGKREGLTTKVREEDPDQVVKGDVPNCAHPRMTHRGIMGDPWMA